uniref:Uncharacterized protein n=1 Tax=Zooxanthella nutricula TaxID=1333877 RepID=A0A7S2INQ6_9DINO
MPILYDHLFTFANLSQSISTPGHVVARRWLQRGREKGFVSVPFTSAVRRMMAEPDVNVCLVSRREKTDLAANEWQDVLDEEDFPTFDVSGLVNCPDDLDPLEPPWGTPLDEPLPTDAEVRAMALLPNGTIRGQMSRKYQYRQGDLSHRLSPDIEGEDAKVLRQLVARLPIEYRTEDYTDLVRRTNDQVLTLLNGMHAASDATRLRWRVACVDGDPEEAEDKTQVGLRAYLVLAGESLEFVPSQYVDRNKEMATLALEPEQLRRMSAEDWVQSETLSDTNVTEALKVVPPGWTTVIKGEGWPEAKGIGAVWRLPPGRRVLIQVDVVKRKRPAKRVDSDAAAAVGVGGDTDEEEEEGQRIPSKLKWLGPLAGTAAALLALLLNSPPFVAGQQRRRELNELLQGVQRLPQRPSLEVERQLRKFEQRVWMDFKDADEAPTVLVMGSDSKTGSVVSRKLVTAGYHVVLLKFAEAGPRVERLMPQGTVLSSARVTPDITPVMVSDRPRDLFEAVNGIDKIVICDCDHDPSSSSPRRLNGLLVNRVLSAWMWYRFLYSERQRAFATKVRIFNFYRAADIALWQTEASMPSDMAYGKQSTFWLMDEFRGTEERMPVYIGWFEEAVCQAVLKSPRLKLNFKRFSGLHAKFYNAAIDNTYHWFLRLSDFEETRVQYEYAVPATASRWHRVRMPFNAFKPMRVDGVPLPPEEAEKHPFRREDVVQMGVIVRMDADRWNMWDGLSGTSSNRLNKWVMYLQSIRVFRVQKEPQVVVVGRAEDPTESQADDDDDDDDFSFTGDDLEFVDEELLKAEAAAQAEIEELAQIQQFEPQMDTAQDEADIEYNGYVPRPKTPVQAVLESGLAYSIIKVNGVNEHPGGKYPIAVQQASVKEPPLTAGPNRLGRISRGDVAALVTPALTASACVNAEILVGECPRGSAAEDDGGDAEGHKDKPPSFRIVSTVQEDVKSYMQQLTPNI